jgi:hypothetical protein
MALTTTWTAQSVVDFTAGTLNTITDCVTEVESKSAKEELAEIKNFTWSRKYVYADTVVGTWRYALPADYHGGDVYLRDITNDKMLRVYPQISFDINYPDPAGSSSGQPDAACIRGRELWLNVPAAGVYRYELEYNRTGDDTTATDFTWIPEIDRFRCCDFAVYQSFMSLQQWDAAGLYKQEWMMDIDKARRADGKQKWKSMNYACPLLFK